MSGSIISLNFENKSADGEIAQCFWVCCPLPLSEVAALFKAFLPRSQKDAVPQKTVSWGEPRMLSSPSEKGEGMEMKKHKRGKMKERLFAWRQRTKRPIPRGKGLPRPAPSLDQPEHRAQPPTSGKSPFPSPSFIPTRSLRWGHFPSLTGCRNRIVTRVRRARRPPGPPVTLERPQRPQWVLGLLVANFGTSESSLRDPVGLQPPRTCHLQRKCQPGPRRDKARHPHHLPQHSALTDSPSATGLVNPPSPAKLI